MKELGVERIAKSEFEKYFKRTFAGKSRLLCAGSYATVLMHRDCRLSAGAGEFVATEIPKTHVEREGWWKQLLYQAVASRDCEHIVRLRAWTDDGVSGGVASPTC